MIAFSCLLSAISAPSAFQMLPGFCSKQGTYQASKAGTIFEIIQNQPLTALLSSSEWRPCRRLLFLGLGILRSFSWLIGMVLFLRSVRLGGFVLVIGVALLVLVVMSRAIDVIIDFAGIGLAAD